jgi:hypothetical protein
MKVQEIKLILALIFCAAITIWILIHIRKREKKRLEAWKKLARKLNFNFCENITYQLQQFPKLPSFTRGRNHKLTNAIECKKNRATIIVSDFSCAFGSNNNRQGHSETICILRADDLEIPYCELSRKKPLLPLISKKGIEIPDDLNFTENFILFGENEAKIQQLFTKELRAAFYKFHQDKVNFEGNKNTIILSYDKNLDPEDSYEIKKLVEKIYTIYEVIQTSKGRLL